MSRSYVVTGGGRGIGRALVERLVAAGDTVVAIEQDPAALAWAKQQPAGGRLIGVAGDGATGRTPRRNSALRSEGAVPHTRQGPVLRLAVDVAVLPRMRVAYLAEAWEPNPGTA